jgi:excisionase family DNA binding protein
MATESETIKIVRGPSSKAYIEGRRITVDHVAEYHVYLGWSIEEIAEAFNLTFAEIYAALSYYYVHQLEIDEVIKQSQQPLEGYPTADDILSGRYKLMMTTSEVAETFGINDRTVREAIDKGWIKARKSGGTWLIRRQDAEARWGKKSV